MIDSDGCPKEPSWKITAVRVVYDPVKHRIYYTARGYQLFGAADPVCPSFSHPEVGGGGGSGLLVPDFRYSRINGLELALPYYFAARRPTAT